MNRCRHRVLKRAFEREIKNTILSRLILRCLLNIQPDIGTGYTSRELVDGHRSKKSLGVTGTQSITREGTRKSRGPRQSSKAIQHLGMRQERRNQ